MNERTIPSALNGVAILFLLMGLSAAWNILSHLVQKNIYLDFNVLGIPIFFGLRSFSVGWRDCALVYTWLGLLVAPVFAVLGLAFNIPATLSVSGVRLASIAPIWFSVACSALFFFSLWQYRVLTRPDIRALFDSRDHAG